VDLNSVDFNVVASSLSFANLNSSLVFPKFAVLFCLLLFMIFGGNLLLRVACLVLFVVILLSLI